MVRREMSDSARLKGLKNADERWRQENVEIIRRLLAGETSREAVRVLGMRVRDVGAIRLRLKDAGELS